MPRIACAVVCVLVLLSGSTAAASERGDAAARFFSSLSLLRPIGAGGSEGGSFTKREDLDLRLRTAFADQPRRLGGDSREVSSSLRLFATGRRSTGGTEAVEPRSTSSALGVRENSFPTRKVALQGTVRDGLFLKVSLGMDHTLERGGIGRPTPSIGLQFETTFR